MSESNFTALFASITESTRSWNADVLEFLRSSLDTLHKAGLLTLSTYVLMADILNLTIAGSTNLVNFVSQKLLSDKDISVDDIQNLHKEAYQHLSVWHEDWVIVTHLSYQPDLLCITYKEDGKNQ